MKNVMLWGTLWIVLICGCIFCPSLDAEDGKKIPLNVGYYFRGIPEVDMRDVSAALKVWGQELAEANGFNADLIFYDTMDQLVKDFTDKKIDFVTIYSIDYLMFQPDMKTKAELANVRHNRVTVKYLLLVNADSEIKRLANLKNRRIAIQNDNRLGMIFLDTELMKAKMPKTADCFAAIQEKNKENQVALAVFFGQADACIITDVGFATMVELNPQLGRKLKVMASSPEMVEIVGFFRNDYPLSYKEKAIQSIIGAVQKSKRAEQMKLLLNTEGMNAITDDQLNSARALLAEYNRLNGGNSNQHP